MQGCLRPEMGFLSVVIYPVSVESLAFCSRHFIDVSLRELLNGGRLRSAMSASLQPRLDRASGFSLRLPPETICVLGKQLGLMVWLVPFEVRLQTMIKIIRIQLELLEFTFVVV